MTSNNHKLKRALLWLPARLYELAVRLRVAAYETGYLQAKRLEATVISIGNLTFGGTGKTPMVEYIARYLESEDHSVAILTRGYARESS
ncbi:MAG TPA: tetraacyldisaccharide 4'-kinase, partial [Blastocatellia bacterium]|nr:tetraacyldisaccharide 4'-kinase [Blastocatellia bacterium]